MQKKVQLINERGSALVDREDFALVSKHRWYLHGKSGYARALIEGKMVYMHRFILGISDKKIHVDHIDGDTLNNSRANLRLATVSQNLSNQKKRTDNMSGYKGVSRYVTRKGTERWSAYIHYDGKKRHLGYFSTAEQAARVYDVRASVVFGKFAHLNFK